MKSKYCKSVWRAMQEKLNKAKDVSSLAYSQTESEMIKDICCGIFKVIIILTSLIIEYLILLLSSQMLKG